MGVERHLRGTRGDRRGGWIAVGARADEEQRLAVLHLCRLHDGEPMLPDGAIHLLRRPPSLRCQFEDVGLETLLETLVTGDGLDQLPAVDIVALLHVAVERTGGLGGGGIRHEHGEHEGEKSHAAIGTTNGSGSKKSKKNHAAMFGMAPCPPLTSTDGFIASRWASP